MNARNTAAAVLLTLPIILSTGCAQEASRDDSRAATDTAAATDQPPSSGHVPAEGGVKAFPVAAEAGLAGTAWRLVKIMSMDDSVYAPEDPDLYTLAFGADGAVSLRADCNRGTGTWSSESAGQLQFGKIAATRAMCAPGSLHDRYLGQFEWVRSYVMEGGHLYLATMADGSIIEFEPLGE